MTVEQERIGIRDIDAGTNPRRFARGRHGIGLAKNFRDGKPHQVKVFGTEVVVFADSAGELHVLDAYCRHMGQSRAWRARGRHHRLPVPRPLRM